MDVNAFRSSRRSIGHIDLGRIPEVLWNRSERTGVPVILIVHMPVPRRQRLVIHRYARHIESFARVILELLVPT